MKITILICVLLCFATAKEDYWKRWQNAEPTGYTVNSEKIYSGPNPNWEELLTTFIETVMACPKYQLPGLAISIVHKNTVIYQRGFGYVDLAHSKPVNEKTLFGIGSCSKAFTSTLAAIGVDRGLIDFDAPIDYTYHPDFELADKSAISKYTLRDLLAHRTGVPRNDYLWATGPSATRKDFFPKIQFMNPDYDLRTKFAYNNFMVSMGAHIVELVSGDTWDNLVGELFNTLDMQSTLIDTNQAIQTGNYAFPNGYNIQTQAMEPYPPNVNVALEIVAPAGSIISNAVDMSNWMMMQLNQGVFNGSTIVSINSLVQTWFPSMFMPPPILILSLPRFPVLYSQSTYAMGWWNGVYRDRLLLEHGGNTEGHSSDVWLDLTSEIGIFITTNLQSANEPLSLIEWYFTDLWNGYNPWLNLTSACHFPCQFIKCKPGEEEKEKFEGPFDKIMENMNQWEKIHMENFDSEPDLEISPENFEALSDYVGIYVDPLYGTVTIALNSTSGVLGFSYNSMNGFFVTNPTYDIIVAQATVPTIIGPFNIPFQFFRNLNGVVISAQLPVAIGSKNIFVTFMKQ